MDLEGWPSSLGWRVVPALGIVAAGCSLLLGPAPTYREPGEGGRDAGPDAAREDAASEDASLDGAIRGDGGCREAFTDCVPVANTVYECSAGECAIASCVDGWGDCDDRSETGCEHPLNDVMRCGSCMTSCHWECASRECNDPVETVPGYANGCSLLRDRTVRCWGDNEHGQLGLGTTSPTPSVGPQGIVQRVFDVPVGVGHLADVVQFSLGTFFACAVTGSGEMLCWGANDSGQCGQGSLAEPNYRTARTVTRLGGGDAIGPVSAVAANAMHACAVLADTTVACWGHNTDLQVGSADDPVLLPTRVAGLTGVRSVGVGVRLSCALTTAGEVWCWGSNSDGSLGRGTTGAPSAVPAAVVAVTGSGRLSAVEELAVGSTHACARLGGEVVCWGSNGNGELGDGTMTARERPVYVMDGAARLSGVTAIAASTNFTCAMVGGHPRCWGRNNAGQLADGTLGEAQPSPTFVVVEDGSRLADASVLRAGGVGGCAHQRGAPHCWGLNAFGQAGNGDRMTRSHATPVLPPLLP
ncbi:MAG: hypothetical protein KF729_28335 [Sandaracinaceae bacterium]|nr:hypothetical protein [Sandaracinaceae bacterium]